MSKVEESQVEYKHSPQKMTLEEYWAYEYNAEGRHEYHDGVLVDVTYKSMEGGQISSNLSGLIGNKITDKDCSVYSNSRMIFIPECNKVYYPDIVLINGKHDLHEVSKNMHTTINPTTVFEILSDSKEEFNKSKKIKSYKKICSLNQIIYVWKDIKYIMLLERTEDGKDWYHFEFSEDEEVIKINGFEVTFKEIYHRVDIMSLSEYYNTEGQNKSNKLKNNYL
jgi:Uma2 family endonuclease